MLLEFRSGNRLHRLLIFVYLHYSSITACSALTRFGVCTDRPADCDGGKGSSVHKKGHHGRRKHAAGPRKVRHLPRPLQVGSRAPYVNRHRRSLTPIVSLDLEAPQVLLEMSIDSEKL